MLKIGFCFCFCFNIKITGKKGEGEGEVLSDRPWWPHLHTSGLSELPWQWPEGSSSDKACKHTTDSSQIQLCALGVCGLLKKKKKKGQRGKKGGGCTPNEEARDVCTALELHNSKRRRAHLTTDFIFLLKKVGVDHETAPRQITVALGLNFLQLLTIREGVSTEGRCLGFHSPTPKVWS